MIAFLLYCYIVLSFVSRNVFRTYADLRTFRLNQFDSNSTAAIWPRCKSRRLSTSLSKVYSSCDMQSTDVPFFFRFNIRSITTSFVFMSSEAVGSSISKKRGSAMMARATLIRCCSPPLKVTGKASHNSTGRPRASFQAFPLTCRGQPVAYLFLS